MFHDLGGFRNVAGHGLRPVSLGSTNIDHVVLSGARWLLVDAKGTGAGTLTLDTLGRGVLIQADGTKPSSHGSTAPGRGQGPGSSSA